MDAAAVRALQGRVEDLAGSVEGVIGVAAKELATGAEVLVNADMVFPTASVMKTPVLWALYREAEAGRIDLDWRIAFEERHLVPGSGVLQDLAFGLRPTVKDLATLMITVSDNAATDMILELLGAGTLDRALRDLGLRDTTLPMTIRGLLYSMVGMDLDDPTHTYALFKERSQAGQIDWGSRALADADNNLSTPRDLNRLLEDIATRATLGAASYEAIVDILKRQKYNTIIPLHLPAETPVAHKTGSLRGVRNDSGIVYAPNGPYLLTLCAKRLADQVAGAAVLAEISRAVWEGFVGPLPTPRYGPATDG